MSAAGSAKISEGLRALSLRLSCLAASKPGSFMRPAPPFGEGEGKASLDAALRPHAQHVAGPSAARETPKGCDWKGKSGTDSSRFFPGEQVPVRKTQSEG